MKTKQTIIAVLALALSAGASAAKDWTTVRIGTEGAYPPFNYVDTNNELQGFDIDIAKALCAQMKVECVFVAQDWDGIIPALLANKYDAIVASMSITDERKQTVDFTEKYYTNALTFVAPKAAGVTGVTPADFAGKTLGAQSATVSANFLEDNYKDSSIKLYATQDEAYLDLANGRLDAVLADTGPSLLWLRSENGSCCQFVGDAVVKDDAIGIAVRKEDGDLRDMLNEAIAAIRANGTYAEINAKYFPFSIY
ncbi:MAG: ABC transporter substrate-binding protein [Hyphomicrobiales bacterium]|nr:ABC transporter substrate-binding protein [Hyphomicrobiales bacterium]